MENMTVFLRRKQAGIIGTYIIQSNEIEIVEINEIEEYWLMKLDGVSRQARADIYRLIGDIVLVEDDMFESSDPTTWGCF